MDEEIKELPKYKLIDIILGLTSLVLLFISIPLNLTNPFSILSTLKDNNIYSKIIMLILLIYFVFMFILLNVYLILFIKGKVFKGFLADMIKGSFIIPLFTCILLLIGMFTSICTVTGQSMEDTFYDNDRVVTLKCFEYDTDDVIIIDVKTKYLIKRVVAAPGDKLLVTENGYVYVNDELVQGSPTYYTQKTYNKVLEKGEYYCLGDNRADSLDSRSYGIFTIDNIYGKVIYKF